MVSAPHHQHHLPAAAIDKIRSISGNDVCMDCGGAEPDWGDVLHGSLHCIQCAGQHRALGVSVSFCRSLTMDNWTEANLLAMLLGGNRQLKAFFTRQRIANSSVDVLYGSRPAAYYREQLAKQVDQLLAKRRSRENSREEVKEEPDEDAAEDAEDDADSRTPRHQGVRSQSAPASAATRPRRRRRAEVVDYDAEILDAELGASLARALPPPGWTCPGKSMALVTKVRSSGAAFRTGFRVGDYVVAMNGRPVADYDEFVRLFPRAQRPTRLTMRRFRVVVVDDDGGSSSSEVEHKEKGPGDDDDQDDDEEVLCFKIDFGGAAADEAPMGFSIERDADGRARVSRVAPGGRAAGLGVKVDDVVTTLNSRDAPTYDNVVDTLPFLEKPIVVGLRRNKKQREDRRCPEGDNGDGATTSAASMSSVLGLRPKRALASRPPSGHYSAGNLGARLKSTGNLGLASATDDDDDVFPGGLVGTKKLLDPDLTDDREFDVRFDDGPLGMRIEERLGLVPVTVVTHVDPKGQAFTRGVRVGCTVQGLNGERYLSHAHTAATLRHGKRPIDARLRHCD
eukprot:CAMPEP_0118889448 /NCGR_PEP_ID=MMETSP1166-20130328/371_1 /TAXON_ID=1104430 /ORGANISM="Chrysoreinhardia sp, Strain CCMP3193" /LENGTH=565 /DNA_ID=CAMNT_0006828039 /DNA_START=115 /DNA_END=1812 /DNA_ORIENTATION=-